MNERIEVSNGTGEKILSPMEKLHTNLHRYSIFNYLPDEGLYRLSQTSHTMYAECKSLLLLLERERQKLVSHIVKAEEEQALAMIRANPKILLYASKAIDYSGRLYNNYTPFQAALLCHDVTLWKKMELYFDGLPDGQTKKAKQFNELFPEGIPRGAPYDFSVLIQTITTSSEADIAAALQKIQNDTALCNALNHFRHDFNTLSMQETFFNPSHLMRALKIYIEQFANWSWAKRDLFWRQVIGYTERFLPACFAQAFIQGIYSIVQEEQPLERSLMFKYDGGSYFPLVDSSGLGFDFGIYGGTEAKPDVGAPGAWPRGYEIGQFMTNYVRQIYLNYDDLSATCRVPESPLQTTMR